MNDYARNGKLRSNLAKLSDEAISAIYADWQVWARDDQLPPVSTGDGLPWQIWLLLGGRGAGKTRAGAEWIRAQALALAPLADAPAMRIALVGETMADVRSVMVEGDSGLLAIHSDAERPHFEPSKMQLTWPNGAVAQMFSAENSEGLRGPQFAVAWCAAFVGACLERGGHESTRSLMARSYTGFGESLPEERFGALAVLTRGRNPVFGHVGFLVGWSDKRLWLLGGNQGDAVSVAGFDRSRLIALRWPNRPFVPEGGKGADIFAQALQHVLEMEGGFTNDRHDPGGPTNKGITLATLARWRKQRISAATRAALLADLKKISAEEVTAIYAKRYWAPAGCSEMPPSIAFFHFDAAVNHGVTGATRMLQEACGAAVDGEMGPETRGKITAMPQRELIERYAAIRRRKYRALQHFWRFGRGWLNRVERTLKRATAIALERTDHSGNTKTTTKHTGDSDMTTNDQTSAKWWGQSMTIWGALVTAAAAILPIVGPVIGLELDAAMVRLIGEQLLSVIQALTALAGTTMTIYGRARAELPLARRSITLQL